MEKTGKKEGEMEALFHIIEIIPPLIPTNGDNGYNGYNGYNPPLIPTNGDITKPYKPRRRSNRCKHTTINSKAFKMAVVALFFIKWGYNGVI